MIERLRAAAEAALPSAVDVARLSRCRKSKRGVVIFDDLGPLAVGCNEPPRPFVCAGDEACRAACNKICIHAEQAALLAYRGRSDVNMLHVEVVDGAPVPSGPPSCWQCSRMILHRRLRSMWLLHDDGLRGYSAEEFHRLTLRHCGLPTVESGLPAPAAGPW